MPNSLTGDFEAVLQVSGGTINRLLASMHQNAFENPKLPSFPHSVRMRIGDDHAYEGVRGLAHAQVAVPRIELIHGASDRFRLEVAVRVWYRPDAGTEPLPAYINGTVRAEYRLHDIDPSCPGYSKNAADLLWFRVVRDSVQFQGTARDDITIGEIVVQGGGDPALNEAANLAKVTRQVARLLAKRFEATPHPASGFRRGSMRSLNGSVAGTAVAVPIGLSGAPSGDINSVDNLFLNGTDFAVALNASSIVRLATAMIQPLATFRRTITLKAEDFLGNEYSATYDIGVHPPSIQWVAQGSYAVLKLSVSGWATTSHWLLPNFTVDIKQDLTLTYDGSSLSLSPGSLSVDPHASGIFGGLLEGQARGYIRPMIESIVKDACEAAAPGLKKLTEQTGSLSKALQSIDKAASTTLHWAEFLVDGMVLRGTIGLSQRRKVVIKQEKTATGDAHSALETWIPGGRIDRFEWSWTWAGSEDSGSKVHTDRFLLRRPKAKESRWGVAIGLQDPLPGLDGWGRVCLRVIGAVINPVTGQFETVVSERRCVKFGYDLVTVFEGNRLHLRDVPELSQDVPFPQLKERAVVAMRRNGNSGANTLVLYAGEEWSDEAVNALGEGLDACRRFDAGLSVLVLFKEGVLDEHGPRLIKNVERHISEFGVLSHVNEDVDGRWAKSLNLEGERGGPGWALISPEGTVPWSHRGRIEAKELGAALDTHLRRSADMKPAAHHYAIDAGSAISAGALNIGDLIDSVESRCPPIPLGRLGVDTIITFVQKGSEASIRHLRRLAGQVGQQGRAAPTVVAVVDYASMREVQALKDQLGLDFTLLPDTKGILADRFRINVWPTTITVNSDNIASDVQVGLARRGDDFTARDEGGGDRSDAAV